MLFKITLIAFLVFVAVFECSVNALREEAGSAERVAPSSGKVNIVDQREIERIRRSNIKSPQDRVADDFDQRAEKIIAQRSIAAKRINKKPGISSGSRADDTDDITSQGAAGANTGAVPSARSLSNQDPLKARMMPSSSSETGAAGASSTKLDGQSRRSSSSSGSSIGSASATGSMASGTASIADLTHKHVKTGKAVEKRDASDQLETDQFTRDPSSRLIQKRSADDDKKKPQTSSCCGK